jgi:hypothetical protein
MRLGSGLESLETRDALGRPECSHPRRRQYLLLSHIHEHEVLVWAVLLSNNPTIPRPSMAAIDQSFLSLAASRALRKGTVG